MKLLCLMVLVLSPCIMAETFCAVNIELVDPAGTPTSARVQLISPEGRVTSSVYSNSDGIARFCDLGFGEHSIQVGDNKCGYVTLHRIRLVYGIAQSFKVVVNQCMIGADGGRYPPSCLLYLRVSSKGGRALSDGEVTALRGSHVLHVDQFGRLFTAIGNGTDATYEISAPGYKSKTIHKTCRSYETIEEAVQLDPA